MKTIPGVLTASECASHIARAEAAGFDEAPITTRTGFVRRPDIRNNTRVMVDDAPFVATLWRKLARHALPVPGATPIGLNERLRYYRYDPGQFFAPHHDGAFVRSETERTFVTVIVYLNDDYLGGETIVAGEPVLPREGQALLFHHPVLHEGAPVDMGRKYVLRTDILYRLD
ncbi:MAG: 2OG-Fe(II) oxygenase [Myxococcota bacterium]